MSRRNTREMGLKCLTAAAENVLRPSPRQERHACARCHDLSAKQLCLQKAVHNAGAKAVILKIHGGPLQSETSNESLAEERGHLHQAKKTHTVMNRLNR